MVDPLGIAVGIEAADVSPRNGDLGVARVAGAIGVRGAVQRVIGSQRNGDLGTGGTFADEVETMVEELAKIGQEAVARGNAGVDGAEEDFAIGRILRVVLAASQDAVIGDDGSAFDQAGAARLRRSRSRPL